MILLIVALWWLAATAALLATFTLIALAYELVTRIRSKHTIRQAERILREHSNR